MAVEIERLVATLEARIDKYEKNLARAAGQTDRQFRRIEDRGKALERRLGAIGGRAAAAFTGALAAGISIRGAQQLIDSAIRIENALKVAGLEGRALEAVYDDLFAAAQRNAVPFEALVNLYSRAAIVQKELGVTTQELTGFAENVALALRVSGQSAEESSGALMQLAQALGSGVVRAEEFNSILEGALPIAQAAAAGLEEAGGSVAKLRQLVVDGKVSSEAFFRAFEVGAAVLEQKVAGAELTVSQELVRLMNVLVDTAREFDDATGLSVALVNSLGELTAAVAGLGDVAGRVVEGPIGQLVTGLIEADAAVRNLRSSLAGMVGLDRVVEGIGDLIAPNPNGPQAGSGGPRRGRGGSATELPEITVAAANRISLSDYPVSGTGSGGSKGGRKGGAARQNALERDIAQIRERTTALQAETAAIAGLNPLAANYRQEVERITAAIDLENAARRAGLAITPEMRAQLHHLSAAYAEASAAADALADRQDDIRRRADDINGIGRDVLGGFVSDLKSGTSAADALASALDRVSDRLLDIALDAVFGGVGGGAGGPLGGLFASIFPLRPSSCRARQTTISTRASRAFRVGSRLPR